MPFLIISLAGTGVTLWAAVTAVRRGDAGQWLWIILVFGPIGALVYLISQNEIPFLRPSSGPRRPTAQDVRHAEYDVRRLETCASYTHLATVLRGRREFARAVTAGQKAVEKDPRSIEAHYELGLSLQGAGRAAEAAQALAKVVEKDRKYDADDALFALAKAQVESSDFPAARVSLEELAGRRGRSEVLYTLAAVQVRTGDSVAAAATLQRLLDDAEHVPDYLRSQVRPWVKRARKDLVTLKTAGPPRA